MTFVGLNASAQDVIVKRNGDELQCKILEVNKNEVKYKRWSNQDGPMFAEKKSDIFMIKYENGEKEMMAYESPALTTSEITIADPTPISNVYLEYKCWKRSGILKWGNIQTKDQTKQIFTNDWLDYRKALRKDKVGKIFAIAGGTFFAGGLYWSVRYIVNYHRYSVAQKEYDDNITYAKNNYNQKYSEYKDAKFAYEKAEREYNKLNNSEWYEGRYEDIWEAQSILEKAKYQYENLKYCEGSYEQSEFGYWRGYYDEMSSTKHSKNISRRIMLGCFATGTPFLITGIIKAKRGHKNASQIVNKYNEEYEKDSKKTGLSKPEFNVGSNGNNLAFTLTF